MSGYEVRRSHVDDEPAVLELMGRALGWRDGDPNAELFRWKHRDSPFGPSPAWVAVENDQIIGFRTFMRWEFEERGELIRAVRAVDTATDPAHQGRGIFKTLTLHALDELRDDAVEFVFNTPNDQSRPGYLKMGWQVVGRLPVRVRPRSPGSLSRMLSARVPADLWSVRTESGRDAGDALAQPALGGLLRALPHSERLRTRRTPEYLRWRYGLPALHYRISTVGSGLDGGLVAYRVRGRGPALEAALCEVLLPEGGRQSGWPGSVLKSSTADYAIALGRTRGMLPLPRQGPLLTCLPLAGRELPDWAGSALSLGDIELF